MFEFRTDQRTDIVPIPFARGRAPEEVLMQSTPALSRSLGTQRHAKKIDLSNSARPFPPLLNPSSNPEKDPMKLKLLAVLAAPILVTLTSCNVLSAATVDVPSVRKALAEAVIVAYEGEMNSVKIEFSVAMKKNAGVDGATFAIPIKAGGEHSTGTKVTFEIQGKTEIKTAYAAIQAKEAFIENLRLTDPDAFSAQFVPDFANYNIETQELTLVEE